MGNKKQAKEITLKQALFDGVVVDLFLLIFSSLIMDCGVSFCITFFSVVAHQLLNIYWACRSKGKVSELWMAFIRFGGLGLIVVAWLLRLLVAITFALFNISWY
jgi:hypothetical protein